MPFRLFLLTSLLGTVLAVRAQTAAPAAVEPAEPPNVVVADAAAGVVEVPRTMLFFDLTVRGSQLFLDWKAQVQVESIAIFDLRGRSLFRWLPAPGSAAIGRWVWDGRDANGESLGHGRYLIRVQTHSGARNQVFAWAGR